MKSSIKTELLQLTNCVKKNIMHTKKKCRTVLILPPYYYVNPIEMIQNQVGKINMTFKLLSSKEVEEI